MVLRNILSNKKRNFLTCLGSILGVAAVMSMSAGFSVMTGIMSSTFTNSGLGNQIIYIYDNETNSSGFTTQDINNLENIDGVLALGPLIELPNLQTVISGYRSFDKTWVIGRSNSFYDIDTAGKVILGRSITEGDIREKAKVCIISKKLAEKLFNDAKTALNKKIMFGNLEYEIVGVDNILSGSLDRQMSLESGNKYSVTLPYTTMESVYGISPRSFIVYCKSEELEKKKKAHKEIKNYLENIMHLKEDSGYITMFGEDMLAEYQAQQKKQGREQSLIAGICMLVGGIGIMNMMFVSVTERTKEIGLRKALGATPQRIQQQFLFESVILSLTGGVVGAVIGVIVSLIISVGAFLLLRTDKEYGSAVPLMISVDVPVMILGLIFSVLIGVIFGWMPARKASRLNPIDALKL
ncbi:MAG: ABC transporter permease [Lachnospiraceae bacterium]|nr:ABC transporter permease [Lachnospiraceae bacterium]